ARFSQADVVMHLPLENTDKLLKLSRNAAVAVMSHSLSQDRARLDVLLEHPEQYQYLGQLGPSYRTERLINEISATKADPQTLVNGIRKIHYPIGYKLGGDGPEALALGILAQINAVMHEQSPPAEFSKSEIASSAFANA
ncbi:MAG: XdhC family protein, partial [Psychrobacter alimentarius]